MTDPTHLNDLIAAIQKPLSRKLVETFRDSSRDPSVAKTDYVQRSKNEIEDGDLLLFFWPEWIRQN
jgi:hypothetical protein